MIKIYSDIEDKKKVLTGINKVGNLVSETYGPKGLSVALASRDCVTMTKDGVSVVKCVELEDDLENIGANLMKDVANNVLKTVGDGTTTSVILAKEMINNFYNFKESVVSPKQICEVLDDFVIESEKYLDSIAIKNLSSKKIRDVASVASNADSDLSDSVAEIYNVLGRNAHAIIGLNDKDKFEYIIEKGMALEASCVINEFMDLRHMTFECKNVKVLIYPMYIPDFKHLEDLIIEVRSKGENLVIIAKEVDSQLITSLAKTRIEKKAHIYCLKYMGNNKILEDLAVFTSAVLINDKINLLTKQITYEMLGTCKSIHVNNQRTLFMEGSGTKEAINHRCKEIQDKIVTMSDLEKDISLERISKLTSGVCHFKVGGATLAEMRERADRLDDALRAVKVALDTGICEGGGKTFIKVADNYAKNTKYIEDKIIYTSVIHKLKSIMETPNKMLKDVEITDNIIDPIGVIKHILSTVVSITKMFLNTNSFVIQQKDIKDKNV